MAIITEHPFPPYPTGVVEAPRRAELVDRRTTGKDPNRLQANLRAGWELEAEKDPTGKSPHEPGAKVDAGKVRMTLITGGMARAIREVAKVGTFGAAKYTDGGWVSVPDGFNRYEDAQQRHATSRHMGESHDPDSNLLHLAHEAWNALAKLDLYLRGQE